MSWTASSKTAVVLLAAWSCFASALAQSAAGSKANTTEILQYGTYKVIFTYNQSSSLNYSIPAGAKFGWCGFPGRDNLYFKVTANTSAFIAAAAPSWLTPTACSTKSPAKSCQVFDGTASDKKASAETTSWGLLSNKQKCVFVFNAYSNQTLDVQIQAQSYEAGNWGGIIFGIFITSTAIVGVIGWGCYLDWRKSAFYLKKRASREHVEPLVPVPEK